jgi:uracil DNA glycosylase
MMAIFFEHNLDHWVEQGIFLLNSVLTTEQGNSGSHSSLGCKNLLLRLLK